MNALNTPKRDPVEQFFLRGLGIERISEGWSWEGMTSTEAADKLDEYVTLRGEIAHRGGSANRVTKSTVKDYAAHIRRLSLRTATVVNDRMWEATGKSLVTREVEAEDRRRSLQTLVPEATSADGG
jgi:hypothetical protein